ncbi:hypothetical protein QR680_013958 [Steinernema hermaphroditum]|uniref:Uncharacterized protein n=1 Tax=Steinernema hermaphroditum TaxID=289476 RepID=A0AA39I8V0_9BILA|nr:hypothetical protein QR680_013958 [Steinernema hermaphroditum]
MNSVGLILFLSEESMSLVTTVRVPRDCSRSHEKMLNPTACLQSHNGYISIGEQSSVGILLLTFEYISSDAEVSKSELDASLLVPVTIALGNPRRPVSEECDFQSGTGCALSSAY